MQKWARWLSKISIDVQESDSIKARRKRLLNVMLLAAGIGSGLTLLAVLVVGPTGQAGTQAELNALCISIGVSLGCILIAYLLNRYVSHLAAGTLFLLMLIILAGVADEPHQVVNGRGLLTFAIPILAAGVVMPPWASFIAAGLSSSIVAGIGLVVEHAVPNVPAIMMFFLLALMAYLSAHNLEQRLEERRRAEKHAQQLLERQIAINQLTLALANASDTDHVYHTLYQHVAQLIDAEAFIISFYDRANQLIRAGYIVNEESILNPSDFPPIPLEKEGQGTQSRVIRTGEPLYVADYRAAMETTTTEYTIDDAGAVTQGSPPTKAKGQATQSALYAPMKIAGEIIGLIQVQSHRPDAYTESDLLLLSSLANIGAIAIQIARLLDSLRRSNEELENYREGLEALVSERTTELQKTIDLMAGREIRMGELKSVIRQLRAQLKKAGLAPVANDPLLEDDHGI